MVPTAPTQYAKEEADDLRAETLDDFDEADEEREEESADFDAFELTEDDEDDPPTHFAHGNSDSDSHRKPWDWQYV